MRRARLHAPPRGIPRQPGSPRTTIGGNTLLGIFIGVALGLGLAAAVAFYLLRSGQPYQAQAAGTREATRDTQIAKAGRGDREAGKPRFDFYKILPGGEEPKVQAKAPDRTSDRGTVERAATPAGESSAAKAPAAGEAKAADRFWLQAGSFANEGDAESLKARLALAGWQATVQEADVPDKGVRYRVRIGPYDNTDELNRTRGELARRGFDVAVIKF